MALRSTVGTNLVIQEITIESIGAGALAKCVIQVDVDLSRTVRLARCAKCSVWKQTRSARIVALEQRDKPNHYLVYQILELVVHKRLHSELTRTQLSDGRDDRTECDGKHAVLSNCSREASSHSNNIVGKVYCASIEVVGNSVICDAAGRQDR
jgi:hypothetical protein